MSPVNLNQALAAFTDIYSPRIVGRAEHSTTGHDL